MAYKLKTGKPWEARAVREAELMCAKNGTKFKCLGSFVGLGPSGEPVPETAEERRRRLALAPRRARLTKRDKRAIERRLKSE
jgi:hypothetical protein